jgi:putative transposase
MSAALELGQRVGQAVACRALGVPRATLYRSLQPALVPKVRPTPGRALDALERQAVLGHLHAERFYDKAPSEVFATLLDDGIYLCSIRTMHRILAQNGELKERRNQLRHPRYKKPELLATGPNRVWSWDIAKLLGPAKWTYFHLYVILDIFSRYVVGWMVAGRETAELAKRPIADTCDKQGIVAGDPTIHAGRGTSMTSRPVALLMADLGVTKTHSRPHVSDDNPYSESQFKTLMPGSPRTGLRPWGGSSTGLSSRNASAPPRTHAAKAFRIFSSEASRALGRSLNARLVRGHG